MKLNNEEGNIGLITNGKGLSDATIDVLDHLHGKVANNLDLTTASSIEDIMYGLDLMEYDTRVKVVLINIFGGGVDTQRISEGIVVAQKNDVCTKPIVIRFRGTFETEANEHLRQFVAENHK